jgi:hypothetical protein
LSGWAPARKTKQIDTSPAKKECFIPAKIIDIHCPSSKTAFWLTKQICISCM